MRPGTCVKVPKALFLRVSPTLEAIQRRNILRKETSRPKKPVNLVFGVKVTSLGTKYQMKRASCRVPGWRRHYS